MRIFQNVNFEKPAVLKVTHNYNNKTFVPQLFKILRSSTRASALTIENFIVKATFKVLFLVANCSSIPKMCMFCIFGVQF
jgi:hypothetical protein